MERLKNCPFCGGDKFKIDSKKSANRSWNSEKQLTEHLHVVTVRCNKCHTRGPTVSVCLIDGTYGAAKLLEQQAITAWNRREGEKDGD